MRKVDCEIVTSVAGQVARHRGFELDGTRLICTAEQVVPSKGDEIQRWILAVLPDAAPVHSRSGEPATPGATGTQTGNGTKPWPGATPPRAVPVHAARAAPSSTNTYRFPGQRSVYGPLPTARGAAAASAAQARPESPLAKAPVAKPAASMLGKYIAVDWRPRRVHVAIDGRDKYCHWMSRLTEPDLVRLDEHAERFEMRSLDNRVQLKIGEDWFFFG